MEIRFYKYQGTGNDFVILDNRDGKYDGLRREHVMFLCDRRFGIGADGLMLLGLHKDYDFEMILRRGRETDIFSATTEYENSNEVIPFHFRAIEKFDKERAMNIMSFYCMAGMESTRTVHLKRYIDLNTALLKLLRNEYHLE